MTLSSLIPVPAISESFTYIILSPARIPIFSEGPLGIVLIISIVSLRLLNDIPIPEALLFYIPILDTSAYEIMFK